MIYVDTSVLLASLLAEDRSPDEGFWSQPLSSSRLLEYETWVRVNGRKLFDTHGERAQALLDRVSFLELHPKVLERALQPFPTPVRTLDALHLASLLFLQQRRVGVQLATYDTRMERAAKAMKIAVVSP